MAANHPDRAREQAVFALLATVAARLRLVHAVTRATRALAVLAAAAAFLWCLVRVGALPPAAARFAFGAGAAGAVVAIAAAALRRLDQRRCAHLVDERAGLADLLLSALTLPADRLAGQPFGELLLVRAHHAASTLDPRRLVPPPERRGWAELALGLLLVSVLGQALWRQAAAPPVWIAELSGAEPGGDPSSRHAALGERAGTKTPRGPLGTTEDERRRQGTGTAEDAKGARTGAGAAAERAGKREGAELPDGSPAAIDQAKPGGSALLEEAQRALDADAPPPGEDQRGGAGGEGKGREAATTEDAGAPEGEADAESQPGAEQGKAEAGEQRGGRPGSQKGAGTAQTNDPLARAQGAERGAAVAAAGTGPQAGLAAVLGDAPVTPLELMIEVETTALRPDAPAPRPHRPGTQEERSSRRGQARTGISAVVLGAAGADERAVASRPVPWQHRARVRAFYLFDPEQTPENRR